MKNKKIFILILLTLLFIAGYVLFFMELLEKNIAFEKIRLEIESEDVREGKLRLLGRDLSDTAENRAMVKTAFIKKDGEVEYVENLEKIAKSLGVVMTINSLEIKEAETNGVEKLSMRIAVGGTWGGVYKFLALLQNLPESVEFSRFVLSRNESVSAKDKAQDWLMSADFDVLKLK